MEDHNLSSQPNTGSIPPSASGSSVPPVLPAALQSTADVLQSVAAESASVMEANQKAQLRAKILASAQLQMNAVATTNAPADVKQMVTPEVVVAPPVSADPAPRVLPMHAGPSLWKRWFALTGAGFAVAALLLLAIVSIHPPQNSGVTLSRVNSVNRLLISEAAASDAFTVYAEKSDARGAQDDSSFILNSRVALTVDQVRQTIQIVPPVPTDIESLQGGKSFRIRPQNQLTSGQVYRIAIPTLVAKTDGTKTARDFSWALQTREDVRVLSTIPADGSAMVPVDTGIEFGLNHEGWENATTSFEIKPAVPGHMELRGRKIVFVPAAPLQPGIRYEARLKQGLKLIGSDLALSEDKLIRFETDPGKGANQDQQISVTSEFQEVFPDTDIQIPVYRSNPSTTTATKVEVQGYVLSEDQAVNLLRARFSIPLWTQVQKNQYADYQAVATNRAFQLTTELRRPSEQAPEMINLPKTLAPGWYAISIRPAGLHEAWLFLQVTSVATYTIADKDRLVVWTVDATTNKPLNQLPVRLGDKEATTDAQGVAQLPTPAFLSSMTTADPGDVAPFDLLVLGKDRQRAITLVGPTPRPLDYGRQPSAFTNTWGYLFPDRPLYRPTDEASVFGIGQDRGASTSAANLEVRLTRSGFWLDFWTGRSKVYAQSTVQTDAAGRFTTRLNWQNLTAGYYQLDLLRDGQLVTSRSIEIRDFVKPAYSLTITKNAERVYAGQEIKGTVSAAFFDGTPVPRAKLTLTTRQKYGQEKQQELTLDANGKADFSLTAEPVECGANLADTCRAVEVLEMEVRPTVGEEGEILGTNTLEVYGSELDIRAEPRTHNDEATVAIQVYRRQLSQDKDQTDVLGAPWSGRTLRGQLVGYYFEKIQDGTYYDFVEKKVKPAFHYERRNDPPVSFQLQTDANGKVNYPFHMNTARDYYEVTLDGQDTQGRYSRFIATVGHGWYEPGMGYGQEDLTTPKLEFTGHTQQYDYAVGESVEVSYQHGTTTLDVSKTPGVLYLTASRGLRDVSFSNQPTYQFVFNEALIPNVEVRAVTFLNKRFEQVQGTAFLKRETRELKIEATADQSSYAPAGMIQIKVKVTDKTTGQPVSDVRVGYAAVDKALLALSYQNPEDPLSLLYQYVPDGVLLQQLSHSDGLNAFAAGAEKGGGGLGDRGAGLRRLFKDTASADAISLDAQGQGTITFSAPDNLTSWRVNLVALSKDVRAGATALEVPVSKPLFVEAVLPPRLATTDKPVIKIRAFGTALPMNAPVNFTIDAPTLGLNGFQATSTADVPVYVGIGTLVPGRHLIMVRVTGLDKTDAVEKWVQVEDSRFLKDEYVSLDAGPGTMLPPTSGSEIELIISGKGRTALHQLIRSLADTSSARLDARLAANQAQTILKNTYQDQSTADALDLTGYQDPEGGIRLLPYATPDVALSSQVAITSPDSFDRQMLADYLWSSLSNASSTADEQMDALSGLAGLGEPVLPDLQTISERSDLTLKQQIAVVRGLVAAGDTQRAGSLLRQLLQQAQRTDALLVMPVGAVGSADRYEATADAAALAAQLGYPEAEALERYVETNWSQEALPVLAKIRYLKARLSALPVEDGSIMWTVDGSKQETLDLKQESARWIKLTQAEAKNFRVTQVSGPVSLEFIRRTTGRPSSVPDISIDRTYNVTNPLDQLMEGDLVRITLTPHWQSTAHEGCYQVRDHLPGGWQAVTQSNITTDQGDYPYEVSDGEVSFTACMTDKPHPITYIARVVSRGTYTAEAPLLQHMQYPSIAAVGKDQTITVR